MVRPNHRQRHLRGKTDLLDAENAARAVLAGTATAVPKAADGCVGMIRQIQIAKDTAVKSCNQAMVTLKTIIVNALAPLREELEKIPDRGLIEHCAELPWDAVATTADAARYTSRTLARRHRELSKEIDIHERILQTLTELVTPTLTGLFGIGADLAAELLIVASENPELIRSEAAFVKVCGVCPIPASSGKDSAVPTLPRWTLPGQRCATPYRPHPHALSRTDDRLRHPPRHREKSKFKIMRCRKRFIAREIYHLLTAETLHATTAAALDGA
ncbi:transposase [Actinomadura geliboluensis]|uniref:transposase n=1 Tax=Actinomadura geliboluensis TaxID=882440 RepID=UPI00371DBA05